MQDSEYGRRRRALEKQLREDLELLRAGYEAKLRALDRLWLGSAEDADAAEPTALGEGRTLQLSGTLPVNETLSPKETLPQPPATRPPLRRGKVAAEITAALPELPEVFDQRDVVRLLGYEVSRGTLHRVFGQLLAKKVIAMQHNSSGPNPTRYRKLPQPLK